MRIPRGVPRGYQLVSPERRRTRRVAEALAAWAQDNLRAFPWREYRREYEILVAEVLLQRTRAEVVAQFIPQFLLDYPDWSSLLDADHQTLVDRLSGLGLQSRRASSLRELAKARIEQRDELPGVGQYIGRAADVMLRGAPVAMVDSNFVRVLQRVFAPPWTSDYRYDKRLQALALSVVSSAEDPRTINLAVLDFGAMVCRPRRPSCGECPLARVCDFRRSSAG
jgi:A/G-specific adenine glycosylase